MADVGDGCSHSLVGKNIKEKFILFPVYRELHPTFFRTERVPFYVKSQHPLNDFLSASHVQAHNLAFI